jgi:N-acetylglutamate synthase
VDEPILEIETAAVLGWQAGERRWLGRWLLRAADGFTGRANSVLPLGPPDRPVPDAIAEVRRWYAARGLTPTIVIPHPLGVPIDDPLDVFLAANGWGLRHGPATVMTARADDVIARCAAVGGPGDVSADVSGVTGVTGDPGDAPGNPAGTPGGRSARGDRGDRSNGYSIELQTEPSPEWIGLYHYQGMDAPPVAARLLVSAPWQAFALARTAGRRAAGTDTAPGTAAAIGRISVGAGWAGLTAIEVAPGHRRRGLGMAVIGALVRYARAESGAHRVYVRVQEDNDPALALYARCGFTPSHRYHYRIDPPSPQAPDRPPLERP